MGLRVGLTGGLGSGKSTVGEMLRGLGAHVLSADEIGRGLMQPGEAVYAGIVERFGGSVVRGDGSLDRGELSRLAFAEGRVEELNAIVHPATIARQGEMAEAIFERDAGAVVVVESALIFETKYGEGWRGRFDRMILVRASEELKVMRYVQRAMTAGGDAEALAADARLRLGRMIADEVKARECEFVIWNEGSLEELRGQVERVWGELRVEAAAGAP